MKTGNIELWTLSHCLRTPPFTFVYCRIFLINRGRFIYIINIEADNKLLCNIFALIQAILFKEATKSYITHNSCVVIVLFNTALCRSAFSTVSFRKLVFRLSVFSLNQDIKIGVIMLCNLGMQFCFYFI